MSHIDSFKHELVGNIGYLPIYHPLENIDGDFNCNTNQLVLGGGSGEHPAVVFENLTCCVAHFLHKTIENDKNLQPWKTIIKPFLEIPTSELLTFYDWDENTYTHFKEMANSTSMHVALGDKNLNDWLVLGMGEFIFFSLPDYASEIMSQLKNPYDKIFHSNYNNILIIPPNFPVYANGGNMFFKKID